MGTFIRTSQAGAVVVAHLAARVADLPGRGVPASERPVWRLRGKRGLVATATESDSVPRRRQV